MTYTPHQLREKADWLDETVDDAECAAMLRYAAEQMDMHRRYVEKVEDAERSAASQSEAHAAEIERLKAAAGRSIEWVCGKESPYEHDHGDYALVDFDDLCALKARAEEAESSLRAEREAREGLIAELRESACRNDDSAIEAEKLVRECGGVGHTGWWERGVAFGKRKAAQRFAALTASPAAPSCLCMPNRDPICPVHGDEDPYWKINAKSAAPTEKEL